MAERSSLPSERWFFFAALLLALLPLWASGQFFVTGDGPCHVYNSKVLLDFMLGRDMDFYDPFYNLNLHAEPNWLSHICLAALQLVLAPEVAEKVFLSAYILVFGFGLRYLLRQINPESVFLSAVGMLFVWHHLLASGFYNFGFSIALLFWVGGYWLRYRNNWTTGRIAALAGLWLLLYFSHAMGTMFSLVFVGSALLIDWLTSIRAEGWRAAVRTHGPNTLRTSLAALPMLAFLTYYWLQAPAITGTDTRPFADLLEDLVQLKSLILLKSTERDTVKAVAILIGLLLVMAIGHRTRERRWAVGDFLLLFAAVALWQYFSPENAKAGGLQIPLRVQTFVWLGLFLWAATANFPEWVRQNTPGAAFVLLVVLTFLRMPAHRRASELVEDYTWCATQIPARSVVLLLNYDFNGLDKDGKEIANRNWLFIHAGGYLGAYKPMILSDNYEASKTHFPINWEWQRDMYAQTTKDGIGFENRPPRADFLDFKTKSGGYDIDYMIFLSYDPRFYDHDYAREIMGQLNQGFEHVGFSPRHKAEIWKRKRQ
ncbi:MAG: hypothetical protein ABMA02_08330 [Saprospiraceae bacterium]